MVLKSINKNRIRLLHIPKSSQKMADSMLAVFGSYLELNS